MRPIPPLIKRIGIAALAVIGLMGAILVYIATSIYCYSSVDEKTQADAAVILGAAAWYKRPSPVFEQRIKHGLWLYENGYVKKLIMTGGKSRNAPFSEAYVARRFALKKKIPAQDILIEEDSHNTYENLVNAKKLMAEHGLKSAIIVSDPYHMKRAMAIADDLDMTAYSSPTPTTRYEGSNKSLRFLLQETGHMIGYLLGFAASPDTAGN